MLELHSFYIFFKNKLIYRSLYTDAARRAVRNCISPGFYDDQESSPRSASESVEFNTPNRYGQTGATTKLNHMRLNSPQSTTRSSLELSQSQMNNFESAHKATVSDGEPSGLGSPSRGPISPIEEQGEFRYVLEDVHHSNYEKLLLGFLSGLTLFSRTICETNDLKSPDGLSVAHFKVCSTHQFKIHYFETITGYKLVCMTSCDFPNLDETLKSIYVDLLNNLVLANPTYTVGSLISSPEFELIVKKTILSSV